MQKIETMDLTELPVGGTPMEQVPPKPQERRHTEPWGPGFSGTSSAGPGLAHALQRCSCTVIARCTHNGALFGALGQ